MQTQSKRRLEGLEKILLRFEKRDRLKGVLETLAERNLGSLGPRSTEFTGWLQKELEDAELALSADRLEKLFEGENLFGTDDDEGFQTHRGC